MGKHRNYEIKTHIVLSASRLFHDKGIRKTSLNDIAVAAGISKPTIYTYFKSKDEIVEAIGFDSKHGGEDNCPADDSEMKNRLVKAALQLFQERGWDETNIQDIVDAVGVTRGAFYHYFKSKEEIVNDAAVIIFNEYNPFIKIKPEENLSGLEKLKSVILYQFEYNRNNQFTKMSPLVFRSKDILHIQLYECIDRMGPYLMELIEEGNRDGSMLVEYPKQASEILAILFNIWLSSTISPVAKEEYMNKVKALGIVLYGMGIPLLTKAMLDRIEQYFDEYLCKE